ncbi:MAG: circularly permuted type 2 ATP-grasp protein [Planctomycetota bacterium]
MTSTPPDAIVKASSAWRTGYAAKLGVFDEMVSARGEIHPHWSSFVEHMDAMGAAEISRRWELALRTLHENGVSYNVYGDPHGIDRPWVLDAVPMMISAREWSGLERSLIQRARLLNLILADIYGPQKLLKEGVLPPELIYAHPGFLRPCHGVALPGNLHLHLYSADIARSPDGTWSVIGDGTQAPAGAGYALENRIVLSRIFPDIFKECHAQRLAMYFRRIRETLRGLAYYNRDNPRIVLLTPGPYHETYFEHAYLARYLNYTLVEGGDLTVRDQCVYLKTLGGLHRVDVILRRLDDDYCDPLELNPESFLGVPGLMQAVRAGNVAISNPLGSGLAESPALKPFLPDLCKHLLGEDLLLPSVPSHWCGKRASMDYALDNLERMIVKASYPERGIESVFCGRLSIVQREKLKEKIRARPAFYVAQEQVELSTAPVLVENRIQPRHAVLRTYLAASEGTYSAMPGGLTQVPTSAEAHVFSLQRGAGSKDTWVQSSGPVSTFSLLRPKGDAIELTRGGNDLPSRVADNLYWLGRYVERAENAVRLMRGIANRISDKSIWGEVRELSDLMRALCHQGGMACGLDSVHSAETVTQGDELTLLLEQSRRPGGLHSTLQSLQFVSRAVRDRISTDTWRVVNSLNEDAVWPDDLDSTRLSEIIERLNMMVTTLASFGGLASESMTRGQVWIFMDMGRRLERTVSMAGLLRSTLVTPVKEDSTLLESVLEVGDSFMTYRRRYLANLQLAPVLDLLLADETNPRSIAFQYVMLNEHIESLPRDRTLAHLSPEQRVTVGGLASLRLQEIEELCQLDAQGKRGNLAHLLTRVDEDMAALSDIVTRQFLSHAQASRQLASFNMEG